MNHKDFDDSTPIYLQIMNKIKLQIISGEWRAGERIPSVRELSTTFGVNPNTMQRSLLELEREGLLFSERTTGRFVTKNEEVIIQMKIYKAQEIIDNFLEQMQSLGYSKQEIAKKILEEK